MPPERVAAEFVRVLQPFTKAVIAQQHVIVAEFDRTDHAPTGPDFVFPNAEDVTVIVQILDSVRQSAVPLDVA